MSLTKFSRQIWDLCTHTGCNQSDSNPSTFLRPVRGEGSSENMHCVYWVSKKRKEKSGKPYKMIKKKWFSKSCLWNRFPTCLHCHQNIKVGILFVVVRIFRHNKTTKITTKSLSASLYIACHQMCFYYMCYSLPTVLSRDSFNLKSRLQVWFGWKNWKLVCTHRQTIQNKEKTKTDRQRKNLCHFFPTWHTRWNVS